MSARAVVLLASAILGGLGLVLAGLVVGLVGEASGWRLTAAVLLIVGGAALACVGAVRVTSPRRSRA